MPVNFHQNRLAAFLCHCWVILPVVDVDVVVVVVVVAIFVASANRGCVLCSSHLQLCHLTPDFPSGLVPQLLIDFLVDLRIAGHGPKDVHVAHVGQHAHFHDFNLVFAEDWMNAARVHHF